MPEMRRGEGNVAFFKKMNEGVEHEPSIKLGTEAMVVVALGLIAKE